MTFDHILADPAWKYNNRLTGAGRTKFGSGASGKYKTERTEDMAKFEVASLAAENSLLWMWTTGPFIPDALYLMWAWGFRYITVPFHWVKIKKPQSRARLMQELYSCGLEDFMQANTRQMPGHYTASNMEPCIVGQRDEDLPETFEDYMAEIVLLGRKGEALLPDVRMAPQTIYHPPMGQHSEKPSHVQRHIEIAYPGQRYIELFARQTRPGWVTLGNEIDGRDLRESIPETANSPECINLMITTQKEH